MTFRGFDLGRIRAAFEVRVDMARDQAESLMQNIVEEGAEGVRHVIRTSVTPTGLRRADRGGEPGRIESGKMLADVDGDVKWEDANTLVGRWGWEDPEDYYGAQEAGTDRIAPMHALPTTFVRGVDRLQAGLRKL